MEWRSCVLFLSVSFAVIYSIRTEVKCFQPNWRIAHLSHDCQWQPRCDTDRSLHGHSSYMRNPHGESETAATTWRLLSFFKYAIIVYYKQRMLFYIFIHQKFLHLMNVVCCMWLSGNTLVSINVVTPRRARLVLRWVTVCGRVNHLVM